MFLPIFVVTVESESDGDDENEEDILFFDWINGHMKKFEI